MEKKPKFFRLRRNKGRAVNRGAVKSNSPDKETIRTDETDKAVKSTIEDDDELSVRMPLQNLVSLDKKLEVSSYTSMLS